MLTQAKASGAATLRRYWTQWTATVAAYALRRRGRLTPERHADLHRRLLVTCRALASASLGEEKEFYESLESLVLPWSSPAVLSRTDKDLLGDLLDRCEAAQRRLGVERESLGEFAFKMLGAAAAGAGIAFVVVTFVAGGGYEWLAPRLAVGLPRWLPDLGSFGGHAKLVLAALVLTLAAMGVLMRAARR